MDSKLEKATEKVLNYAIKVIRMLEMKMLTMYSQNLRTLKMGRCMNMKMQVTKIDSITKSLKTKSLMTKSLTTKCLNDKRSKTQKV